MAVLSLIGSASSVYATDHTFSSSSFDSKWEKTASGDNWLMTYGFNTAFINEDYTWTMHNTKTHSAVVINGNGTFAANNSYKNWAKKEVTHKDPTVKYRLTY